MQVIEYNDYYIKLPMSLFPQNKRDQFIEEVAKKASYRVQYMGSYQNGNSIKELGVFSYDKLLDAQKKFQYDTAVPDNYLLYADSPPIDLNIVKEYFSNLFSFLGFEKPYEYRTKIITIFGSNVDGTGDVLPHIDYPNQIACCINIPLEGDFSPPIVWYDDMGNELERITYPDNIAILDVLKLHGVDGLKTTGRSHLKIKLLYPYWEIKERFLTKVKNENFDLVYKEPSIKGKNNGT